MNNDASKGEENKETAAAGATEEDAALHCDIAMLIDKKAMAGYPPEKAEEMMQMLSKLVPVLSSAIMRALELTGEHLLEYVPLDSITVRCAYDFSKRRMQEAVADELDRIREESKQEG